MTDPDMLTFAQLRRSLEGRIIQSIQLEDAKCGLKIILTNGDILSVPFSRTQYIDFNGELFDDEYR